MSDDENVYEDGADGSLKTRFLSRAPTHRSKEVCLLDLHTLYSTNILTFTPEASQVLYHRRCPKGSERKEGYCGTCSRRSEGEGVALDDDIGGEE